MEGKTMKRNSYKPVIDRKAIAALDREITAIHKQMRKLEKITLNSAESWQAAWDKCPGLRELEISLFRKRGYLQIGKTVPA